MSLNLDVQYAVEADDLPSPRQFNQWATAALLPATLAQKPGLTPEVSLRVVDKPESNSLNLTYRGQDKPTNVLSFPADIGDDVPVHLLGDIVICADVVRAEAQQQQIKEEAHWAHMMIHGMLHLQGMDHQQPDEAEQMEQLENQLMQHLGFRAPYPEYHSDGQHP